MNKDRKKQLLVIFIALIMFASSAAWIIVGYVPMNQPENEQPKIPDTYVVNGRINDTIISQLFQYGYTIMEFHYYDMCCQDLQSFIDFMPSQLENQIYIQKINDSDTVWVYARSVHGEQTWNVTNFTQLLPPLCDILSKPPIECGLMKFANQSE